jgi:hypothetical protein
MDSEWYYTEEIAKRHSVPAVGRIALLAVVLAMVLALMLPLYQRGINRSLTLEYRRLQQGHRGLLEQQQVLQASISSLGMPESLIDEAWREQILLIPITEQSIYSVARSGP